MRLRLALCCTGLVAAAAAIAVVVAVRLGDHGAGAPAPLPPGVLAGSPAAEHITAMRGGASAGSGLHGAWLVGLCALGVLALCSTVIAWRVVRGARRRPARDGSPESPRSPRDAETAYNAGRQPS